MKLFATVAALGTLTIAATSSPLSAQGAWLGGGATIPTSDYSDYANTGFLLTAGVGTSVGDGGLGVAVEALYGQNNHETDGDKTTPWGFMGQVAYNLAGPGAESGIYVLGQLGVLWHKFSSATLPEGSESGFAYGGAVGYGFPLGGADGFVEGKFIQASISDENTRFLGILAGVSIPFGS